MYAALQNYVDMKSRSYMLTQNDTDKLAAIDFIPTFLKSDVLLYPIQIQCSQSPLIIMSNKMLAFALPCDGIRLQM